MFKDALNSIEGIGVFPAISLLIFFIFFLGVFTWMYRTKSTLFETISRLPLDEDNSKTDLNNPNF